MLLPVLVLLLFSNQTWADSLCLCEPDGKDLRSGCCHTMHFPVQASQAMQEDVAPQSKHHCSLAESPVADIQPGQLGHSTMICCHLQPDTKAQAIAVTAQIQGMIVATLPFIYFDAQSNSAPLPVNFHHPHQKRPLYLSYSCLLI